MKKFALLPLLLLAACGSEQDPDWKNDTTPDRKQAILDSIRDANMYQSLAGINGHCENKPGVPERKTVEWKLPDQLSKAEQAITGTWVATLGDIALSTGGVGIMTDPGSGKTGIDALVDAVEKNRRMNMGCAWLEFYDDHTGFWNSCMLNNGSPSALDNVDPFTGEHSGAGVKFEWYLDGKSIRIKFEDCLKFPLAVANDSATVTARVQYWDLQIVKYGPEKDGMNTCITRDYLPEYEYKSPVKYEYSYSSKLLSGKIGKYKSAIMD